MRVSGTSQAHCRLPSFILQPLEAILGWDMFLLTFSSASKTILAIFVSREDQTLFMGKSLPWEPQCQRGELRAIGSVEGLEKDANGSDAIGHDSHSHRDISKP